MNSDQGKYHGITIKSIETENFNISLNYYSANSIIRKHSHNKPYLCLLSAGTYIEESDDSSIIKNGFTLYRTANYEHSNKFSNQEGVCLNIEIDKPEKLISYNNLHLPLFESIQKGSLDIYRLLYSFKNDIPKDLLDIYCYESLISHFGNNETKGKLEWISEIIDCINDDPISNISLNKLSEDFQLHPNYIVRKFKEVTGYKLSEFLTKIRLEYSIRDLIQTNNQITQIALDSGFYDQSHFNRNFKNQFSVTPKMFRKTIKG